MLRPPANAGFAFLVMFFPETFNSLTSSARMPSLWVVLGLEV